jgi:undecaprenyl-diphosphatase
MSSLQSLLLGLVQGLTEFIPVSSTAHLILVPWVLGWNFDPQVAFVFDVLLQLGTLVAVVAYFWSDLWNIARALALGLMKGRPFAERDGRLGGFVLLATLPAVAVGATFKSFFESLHHHPTVVAGILLGTAGLLVASERVGRRARGLDSVNWRDALFIGCAQSLALLPGVSRSAATICGGLVRDLERPAAARFSFLMSVPVLIAAGAVAVKDLLELSGFTSHLPPLAWGFVAAAVSGFASIGWLLGYLARHPLHLFAGYRVGVGLICLVLARVRP